MFMLVDKLYEAAIMEDKQKRYYQSFWYMVGRDTFFCLTLAVFVISIMFMSYRVKEVDRIIEILILNLMAGFFYFYVYYIILKIFRFFIYFDGIQRDGESYQQMLVKEDNVEKSEEYLHVFLSLILVFSFLAYIGYVMS
jgi:hypothetical protein